MKQKSKENKKAKKQVVEEEQVQKQEQQEEEQQQFFIEIQKLQEQGINAADITKLKNAGFCTVSSIVMTAKKEIMSIKGINQAKIEKIIQAAKKLQQFSYMTGNQVANKRKHIRKITTGSAILDELLGGGIQSKSITQAFGEFRTGKTQLALTLCVTCQLPLQKGGGNGKAIFIDTQGTFRPQRIMKIAERFNMDGEETLNNIRYARAYTVDHLISLLQMSSAIMMESPHALIVIDSIMAVFRSDYQGRGELSQRQQVLGKTLNRIIKISEQYNVSVFMTNQVMADPGNTMAHVDPKKPIGGHVLAHASTTRLYFRKGKGQQRICKVFDSPSLPESECTFEISEYGVMDAKE